MKTLSKSVLALALLVAVSFSITGCFGGHSEMKSSNDHMGNHMHEGKMKNHMNKDGMTDKDMKKMSNHTH